MTLGVLPAAGRRCTRNTSLSAGRIKILSEASVGKAYLEAMKVGPFFAFQNHEPRAGLGRNMSTYYGGRAESGIRRKPTQVMYCGLQVDVPDRQRAHGLNATL